MLDDEWTRSFDEDPEKSQIGPAPDPRMSGAHNLRYAITGGKDIHKHFAAVAETQNFIDAHHNDGPEGERKTTQGYKDRQKRKMFGLMREMASRTDISPSVLERACAMFAVYRDVQEQVTREEYHTMAVAFFVAACEDLSKEAGGHLTNAAATSAAMAAERRFEESLAGIPCKDCGKGYVYTS